MASGRRDYTWGFLNEAAGEGRYRTSFQDDFMKAINTWQQSEAYSYTVLPGYRLGFCNLILSTDSGVYNYMEIRKSGVMIMRSYFTGTSQFFISDNNPLYFVAGDVLSIQIQNRDEGSMTYLGWICGILEYVI